MTTTLEKPRARKAPVGPKDFLHYISCRDADLSVLEGLPVIALCGFQWGPFQPTDAAESEGRRIAWAGRMGVCPECQRRYDNLPRKH